MLIFAEWKWDLKFPHSYSAQRGKRLAVIIVLSRVSCLSMLCVWIIKENKVTFFLLPSLLWGKRTCVTHTTTCSPSTLINFLLNASRHNAIRISWMEQTTRRNFIHLTEGAKRLLFDFLKVVNYALLCGMCRIFNEICCQWNFLHFNVNEGGGSFLKPIQKLFLN